MTVTHAIKVIKRDGVWSFADKERGIEHAEFCNGADILLNHYAQDCKSVYIMFADEEFEDVEVKTLSFTETIRTKMYYSIKVLEGGEPFVFRIALGKPLLQYFEQAPEFIYFKIILEDENQKPNPE